MKGDFNNYLRSPYLNNRLKMYPNLKTKNILFIDDDLDVLENISLALKPLFNTFYTASDGFMALDIYYQHHIDILFVDIQMPKMSGLEFIKKIRKVDSSVVIVIISAYTNTDYLLESIQLNLVNYIVKPLTVQKVHTILGQLEDIFGGNHTIEIADDIVLDVDDMSLKYKNHSCILSKMEMDFLKILALKKVVTYDDMDRIWESEFPTQNAIRVFIKKLRNKLPVNFLENRRSIGYALKSDI